MEESRVSVVVRIPAQLRPLTGGEREIAVTATTVGGALDALEDRHPGVKERIVDPDGQLRRFVNIFLADRDIRFLKGLDTPVGEDQTLSVVPAISGG
jgi:molybdopterin synthase sulfur carrier subunit